MSISIIIVNIKDYINGQLLLIMRLRQVLGLKTLCLRLLVKRSKVKKNNRLPLNLEVSREMIFFQFLNIVPIR